MFAVLGIFVPIYFFIFINILGAAWIGYNNITEYISVLGSNGSPFRFVISIFGFFLVGATIIGLAMTLEDQLQENYFSDVATRLLIFSGIMIFLLGIFPTDRSNLATLYGEFHKFVAGVAAIAAPVSILFYSGAFKHSKKANNGFWIFVSIMLGSVALLAILAIKFTGSFGMFYAGFLERFSIGAILLWIFLTAINLFLNLKFKQLLDS